MYPLLYCILADRLIVKCMKYEKQEAYYLIHTVMNLFISYLTFPSIVDSYYDLHAFVHTPSTELYYYILYLHVYHIICYFSQLKSIDWSHHIVAFMLVGIGLNTHYMSCGNVVGFFMCGLPGVLYYFPLYLSIHDIISRETQKKINFFANFFRCGGIVYGVDLGIVLYNLGLLKNVSPIFSLVLACLCYWNAFYFLYLVVVDYGKK